MRVTGTCTVTGASLGVGAAADPAETKARVEAGDPFLLPPPRRVRPAVLRGGPRTAAGRGSQSIMYGGPPQRPTLPARFSLVGPPEQGSERELTGAVAPRCSARRRPRSPSCRIR